MSSSSDPDDQQQVHEFLDRDHSRASIRGDGRMVIDPAQVLENIALAMERLDADIDTPVSIEEDVLSFDELASLVQSLWMGPTLAVHVLNTAMRIMSARYPAELVTTPLPAEFDLRKIHSFQITDDEHELAKTLFNRRTISPADLAEDDLSELESMDSNGHIQIFVILFYMYGTKIGAMKHRTGIA